MTTLDWYQEIPCPIVRRRAIAALKAYPLEPEYSLDTIAEDIDDSIDKIDWDETKEGYEYWDFVFYNPTRPSPEHLLPDGYVEEGEIRNIPREIADQYQEMFDLMSKEHGLTLTISEMDEIILAAQNTIFKINNPLKPKAMEIEINYNYRSHPENFCHECGGKNPCWHADNELWNKLTSKEHSEIICPSCFQKRADEVGINIIFKAVKL